MLWFLELSLFLITMTTSVWFYVPACEFTNPTHFSIHLFCSTTNTQVINVCDALLVWRFYVV